MVEIHAGHFVCESCGGAITENDLYFPELTFDIMAEFNRDEDNIKVVVDTNWRKNT